MIRGLFCGVSEYRANQQLPYCINDAKKMKEVFTENLVCSDDSIVVLAQDGRIENSEYIRELVRFSENCMEEDIAVVYYSGHGGIDERGDNYLYATNTFDGNDMTCVYFDVIIEHLKKSKAKSKLVIIDCCHADSNYGSEKQKFDTDKAIKDIYQSGITAVFSCRKDQESHPYYDNEISAFTQFFCDAVSYKKSYQPKGLYLSDLKITLDAYARVWNIKNESMQQVPVLRSNMIGTVVFPLKYPPKISERKKRGFVFDDFDALDFQWQVKKPKEIEHYQKVYRAEVVAKVDIDDENIAAFLQNVINKLKEIEIPYNVKKLPHLLFMRCTSIENIYLPYGLEEIDDWALACDSENLKEIVIPETVDSISDYAFSDDTELLVREDSYAYVWSQAHSRKYRCIE